MLVLYGFNHLEKNKIRFGHVISFKGYLRFSLCPYFCFFISSNQKFLWIYMLSFDIFINNMLTKKITFTFLGVQECHDFSLELATKVKACKGAGQE
jgi:hypothetical protein